MRELRSINRRGFAKSLAMAAAVTASRTASGAPAADLKLGLYSITYLGVWYDGEALTLEQVVERARKYGYQGVEIDGKRPHADPLDMPESRCRELRSFAEDQGIEEAARYAGDHGVTLALQNHAPVIRNYGDVLRMIREVDSPHLKACFDARLEYGKKGQYLLDATREFGDLQILEYSGDE